MQAERKGNINKGLILSFSLLIIIFAMYGVFSIVEIQKLSRLTRTIYEHPLVVSNAALQANASITKMHRNMKDIVLFVSVSRIENSIAKVDKQEDLVYQNLNLVRNKILGREGKDLEDETRILFSNWRPIRQEVIALVKAGNTKDAAEITIGKGADHVAALEEKMLALTNYARTKASSFMEASQKTSLKLNILSIGFFCLAISLTFVIAILTLNKTKVAEKEIQESRQLLMNAIDYASIGMVMVEPNGKFHRVNESFCTMIGYLEAELLQMNFDELTHPNDINIDSKVIRELINHEQNMSLIETRYVKKDGEILEVCITTTLLKDDKGDLLYFFIQVLDITLRKETEKQLIEREYRYRRLFDNAPIPLWEEDFSEVYSYFEELKKNGVKDFRNYFNENHHEVIKCLEMIKIIEVNQAAVNMHRAPSKEDLLINLKSIFTKRSIENFKEELIMLAMGKMEFEIEGEVKTLTDEIVDIHLLLLIDKKEDGYVALLATIDITERKLAETERQILQAQLAQAQKIESIGNLAGGIAHDFNNILSSIIGYTELALADVKKGLMVKEDLHEIYIAAQRAKELVSQILAFARKSEEISKPIQVDVIIREVLQFIRSSIPSSIEITMDINSNSNIMGNPIQVHQILMNLCTNASQAMEDDGGTIHISLNDVEINKPTSNKLKLRPGSYIKIEITDTGTGIPKDVVGSIFDPYFTTKDVGEGTGMGLAVVHGIVESYKGKIFVNTTLGQGSTFIIYLPITDEIEIRNNFKPKKLSSGSETILFVDDEPSIVKMSKKVLERLGYNVVALTSSLKALQCFKERPYDFDLVISDMTMPDLTGDKLAIEFMRIRPDIPFILCTGYSKKMTVEKAYKIGIKDFLNKPIATSELTESVKMVLEEANKSI